MKEKSLVTREDIVAAVIKMLHKEGFEKINARSVAKELNMSTKPIYRLYDSMDELIEEVEKTVHIFYENYVDNHIDNKNPVATMCIAHVEFAEKYKNYFKRLFLAKNLSWNKLDDILNEKLNQSIVVNMVNKHGFTFKDAKEFFTDMWLYTNGLATTMATNDIKITKEEIANQVDHIYKILITKYENTKQNV
ncbi:MAG: TetR/AcrR family transcriptional regulator [Bacilli bacterium]|nr:TetR/AcrR family transcriptional regulator [Bacilli bacterium]